MPLFPKRNTMHVPSQVHEDEHTPKYNVKAVAHLVGISAVTLRAWERRYGLPSPQRGSQGYRLYSEYDVLVLRWLKTQTENGMNISRAAQYLADLRQAGADPALAVRRAPAVEQQPASPENLARRCVSAWMVLDEHTASEALRLAFSLYPVERVLMDVVRPALVDMGERWHRGEITIAAEHFATQFCIRHLMSMLSAMSSANRPGVIVAACAPGEQHELGLLMLVVMLRWRGWDVRYLGPNLSLERLEEALGPLRPRLLLFTATRPEAARALRALPDLLLRFPAPMPRVLLGGRGFSDFTELDEAASGHIHRTTLDATITDLVASVEAIMLAE